MKQKIYISTLYIMCGIDVMADVVQTPLPTNVEALSTSVDNKIEPAVLSSGVNASVLPSNLETTQTLPSNEKQSLPILENVVEYGSAPTASVLSSPNNQSQLSSGEVSVKVKESYVKDPSAFRKKKMSTLSSNAGSNKPVAQDKGAPSAAVSGPTADQTFRQERMVAYDKKQVELSNYLKNGQKKEALRLMNEMWDEALHFEDFGLFGSMAYLAMEMEDEATALKAIRKAAELAEDDEFYEHWGNIEVHFKHIDAAENVLKKMNPKSDEAKGLTLNIAVNKANEAYQKGNYADAEKILLAHQKDLDERGLELLAWSQYRYGKLEDSANNFTKAYKMAPSKTNAQGMMFAFHRLKRYEALLEISRAKPGPLDDLLPLTSRESIAAGGKRFTVGADGQLVVASGEIIDVKPGVSVKINPNIRNKPGTDGEGRLNQRGVAMTAAWQGEADRVSVQADVVRTSNDIDESTGQRFYALWQHSEEDGLVYKLGLGRTLTGGVIEPAIVGEAGIGFYTSTYGLSGRVFRRSVEESLLSISGNHSSLSGLNWGRVLETGLTISGNYKLEGWNTESSLTASSLKGVNVADNKKIEFYGRALYPVDSVQGLAVGPEIFANHFQRNLSYYDYGFGGYWSPERSVRLGGLASYDTNIEGWQLKLLAGMGWGWETQAAADGNPITGANPGLYPASSTNGLVYLGQIDALYPIDKQWSIGFNLGGQKSTSYTEWRFGIYAESLWGD